MCDTPTPVLNREDTVIRSIWSLAAVVLCLVAGTALPARADEIGDQIRSALQLYENGDYAGAASELEYAAMQIRQMQAGRIADALPQPLSGWQAEDVETAALPGMARGGGSSAGREYTKGDTSVEIQIMVDAPMIQGLAMMMNNPMIAAGSGNKLIKVKGQKALLQYDAGDHSGELQILVGGNVLVTVNGSDVSQEDLQAYADAVDYELILKIAAGD
jgi:hypothetical protein